jgi:vWA-MoxR associated protein C-terminal domain/Effector-associated domain 1
MGLTDDQIFDLGIELSDALCTAFLDEESLDLMVKRSLKMPLNKIKQNAQNYEVTVEKVVERAISDGKTIDLIIGALKRSPGNPKLRKISQDKLQELLLIGKSILLSDDFLVSLIQVLKSITGNEEFDKIVLPACTRTLPDIDINFPDLREQLYDDELSDATKWLIILDILLNKWERNREGQFYIVLFIENLKYLTKESVQTALTQWLNDLPESIRPVSQTLEKKIYSERPPDEALQKIQAYFLLFIEPIESYNSIKTYDSDKYGINGYVITRLGSEDRYTKIESIPLQVVLSKELNNLSNDNPYYTLEQIKNEFPEWLVQATEWIGTRCRKIEKDYNLDFILSPLLNIEFWLPLEHLSTATEAWEIYGLPYRLKQRTRILGKEHSVLVRCYDRFSEQESFDKLNRNWQVLVSHSQKSTDASSFRVNSSHLDCWNNREELQSQLSQPCLSLSLTCPLCSQDYKRQREDLFTWMLDKGIPLVLWSRSVGLTDDQKTPLKQKMQELLTADIINQLEQFLEQVKQARADTNDTDKLALWCDEPKRLMELKKFREKGRLRA